MPIMLKEFYTTGVISDTKNIPNPGELLQAERRKQTVDPNRLHEFLEGSKEKSESFKRIVQQIERDPVLTSSPRMYDMSKAEQRDVTVDKINRLSKYIEVESFSDFNLRLNILSVFDPQVMTRIGVNLGLFLSCVRGSGTFEQLKFWALDQNCAYIRNIYGCFAMTELAHGSNVAGIETTATFDKESDEFVINTPHIGATKWWIGGAAHSATHSSVYARLIVDGKDYGVKAFVVPLRDINHELNPGITVGDIGAKMGRDGIDNGWIQFSNVRIPRFFMLQKWCTVSRNGTVKMPPLEQLSYSALLGGRVMMVNDSYRMTARVSTIALRYAIGRRQFKAKESDALETQLLDYPLHQRRLLPYLAAAYVMAAGSYRIDQIINETTEALEDAVDNDDAKEIEKCIGQMKSLFIDSGSLKSTCTWLAAEAIDQCRQACGGHGYSAYSGFGKAYADWAVQCTWEGDNNVLGLNIGKPIVKHSLAVLKEDKVVYGSTSFLTHTKQHLNDKPALTDVKDARDLKKVVAAIELAILRLAARTAKIVEGNGMDYGVVGNDLVNLSKLKCHHFLLKEFSERLNENSYKEVNPILATLGALHGATQVFDRYAGIFLAEKAVSPEFISGLNATIIPELCAEIRPHVVGLTDGFQQSDAMINSGLGCYDGNTYENYFRIVKQLNPPENFKAPYSDKLEAMLRRQTLEVRDRGEKSEEAEEILSVKVDDEED
ncbi:fatty-acyl coenzyme A oxidase [Scheffersomyces spartinae]|uniref:Acyl-coenzyme A oxidase n=1 Tax=Scheffersomyces spartinae TaxID=45513 RepID=A0A9P7VA52_9ASCO|nr:fatty-acyl coenzyme A oxidase [Scheffersomyces spartinae]KAG7194164.1 fatty-acyl coenzyme A oxidase [Scheffersomyces spartinae]